MKKFLTLALLGAFVAGAMADSAFAQKKGKKRKKVDRKALFEKLNTDKKAVKIDGKEVQVLTESEFLAQYKNERRKKRGKRQFTRMDKNKDGNVTLEEFTAPRKRKKKGNA